MLTQTAGARRAAQSRPGGFSEVTAPGSDQLPLTLSPSRLRRPVGCLNARALPPSARIIRSNLGPGVARSHCSSGLPRSKIRPATRIGTCSTTSIRSPNSPQHSWHRLTSTARPSVESGLAERRRTTSLRSRSTTTPCSCSRPVPHTTTTGANYRPISRLDGLIRLLVTSGAT